MDEYQKDKGMNMWQGRKLCKARDVGSGFCRDYLFMAEEPMRKASLVGWVDFKGLLL